VRLVDYLKRNLPYLEAIFSIGMLRTRCTVVTEVQF